MQFVKPYCNNIRNANDVQNADLREALLRFMPYEGNDEDKLYGGKL